MVNRRKVGQKPAKACVKEDCTECEIYGKLMCIHTKLDLLDFFMLVLNIAVPFFLGMVIGNHWYGLFLWFVISIFFFGYVEALILCRHCPHYKEDCRTLRCHANWGLPKIPPYSPKPMNRWEKILWITFALVLVFFWFPFFILSKQWIFLIWASVSSIVSIYLIKRTKCNRCYMIYCPMNNLPEDVKQVFYKNYPDYNPEK
jgi:hypothetical protein